MVFDVCLLKILKEKMMLEKRSKMNNVPEKIFDELDDFYISSDDEFDDHNFNLFVNFKVLNEFIIIVNCFINFF